MHLQQKMITAQLYFFSSFSERFINGSLQGFPWGGTYSKLLQIGIRYCWSHKPREKISKTMLLLPPTLYWFLRYNNLLNTAMSKKKYRECKSMRLFKNMLKCNLMFNAPAYFCDALFIKMWFDEIFRSHSKLWAEYK